MFKVYNKDICLWCRFGIFFVNFKHISQPVPVFLLLTLNMHLFAGMAVCFIFFIVHVTVFSLVKHERVRTYILISQFSTKISYVDFRLFLKNCCIFWGLLFQNPLWWLAYFYVVAEVDDFRRIYTSLVA